MKHLILLVPVLLLCACASKPPKKIVIVPALTPSRLVSDPTGLRSSEEIREYHFGRYVDPGSHQVMHEAHPVYRVERTADWNLVSAGSNSSLRGSTDASAPSASPNDAVVAEINKQKAVTKVFTEQSAALNQRLSGLAEAVTLTKQIAEQQVLQQRDIAAIKSRLAAVEKERAPKPGSTPGKSTTPTDETW
jgi:hypothetical protein